MIHPGQDVRFAFRFFAKSPGVTSIAVVVLALGIGGNTAIFSLVHGILLRPLSLPEADRIVQLQRSFPEGDVPLVSVPKFHYWRQHSESFAALAGWELLGSGFNLSGDGRPERLKGSRVTADFFTVFGVSPAWGRDFVPGDDLPGAPPVVILSHRLWQRRFGADPDVLGQSLTLDGEEHVVVGVAPKGFRMPEDGELWTPWRLDAVAASDEVNLLHVTGRLEPGATLAAARAEMRVVGRQFLVTAAAAQPDSPEQVTVTPLQEFLYGDLRPPLLIMLAAVTLVLLIACANVANLQLARSVARRKEIALRAALGATAPRIFGQLVTESILLALAGGVGGIVACLLILRPVLALSPMPVPRLDEVGIDPQVLLFTLAISLLTGGLFGILPALHACRIQLTDSLHEGSLRTTGRAGGNRTRMILVGSQVALAVMLTIAAALLVRSFVALRQLDLGLDPDNVLTMKMSLGQRYRTPEAIARLGDEIAAQISGLPGVAQVTASSSLPFELGPEMPFTIVGRDPESGGIGQGRYVAIAGDYFAALDISLHRGRRLRRSDREDGQLVVVVNEAARRTWWPDQDPIGQHIHLGLPHVPAVADPSPRRIVGIVDNTREAGLDQDPGPILYVPLAQMPPNLAIALFGNLPLNLIVKGDLPAVPLAPTIIEKVWSVDPQQPVSDILLLRGLVARSLGGWEFNMLLLGLLATVALLLAAVGIYGVLAYLVNQQTREIGVRMAFGAGRGAIIALMVRQSMGSVLAGIVVGLLGATAATRLLSGLIHGISHTDWVSFLAVPILFSLVALIAAVVPARRAVRVDPTEALRSE